MVRSLGPSGLLRLAAVITLGVSILLTGCAAAAPDVSRAVAAEKDGWTRCDHDHSVAGAVICLQR
jgi:hypothetical protein